VPADFAMTVPVKMPLLHPKMSSSDWDFFLKIFLMISRRQIISRSAGPIFAIFTSNESVLGVDDRSGPLF